eukprot:110887-Chlamydomonas_euryale.AAC.1
MILRLQPHAGGAGVCVVAAARPGRLGGFRSSPYREERSDSGLRAALARLEGPLTAVRAFSARRCGLRAVFGRSQTTR